MCAFLTRHSSMMLRTAVILLFLMKTLKCDEDENVTPQPNSHKLDILSCINRIRRLHDVPDVGLDILLSASLDSKAQSILDNPSASTVFISGFEGKIDPHDYFPLVDLTRVANFADYLSNSESNPIYKGYRNGREWYPGVYDKRFHAKYGFYTQLIWKSAKMIAVGMAYKIADNRAFDILMYLEFIPEGNKPPNAFEQNVQSARFTVPEDIDSPQIRESVMDKQIKNMVNLINRFRQFHNAPPVTLDEDKNSKLNQWAYNLALSALQNKIGYLDKSGYVPLIYRSTVKEMSLLTDDKKNRDGNPVRRWYYDHRKYYLGDYYADNHMKYAPYTQLLWKSSTKVAIAITEEYSTDPSNDPYVIGIAAHWEPKGNIIGSNFTANVDDLADIQPFF